MPLSKVIKQLARLLRKIMVVFCSIVDLEVELNSIEVLSTSERITVEIKSD